MKITRPGPSSQKGPDAWFSGEVFLDVVAEPEPPSRTGASITHFSRGARTAWHTHPFGQTIYVFEGRGRCQREGGSVEELAPGDRVFFKADENHWHGAAPDRMMSHLAIQEYGEDGPAVWAGSSVTTNTRGDDGVLRAEDAS